MLLNIVTCHGTESSSLQREEHPELCLKWTQPRGSKTGAAVSSRSKPEPNLMARTQPCLGGQPQEQCWRVLGSFWGTWCTYLSSGERRSPWPERCPSKLSWKALEMQGLWPQSDHSCSYDVELEKMQECFIINSSYQWYSKPRTM